jgi:hypothetical protein
MGKMKKTYIFIGEPERKTRISEFNGRWEDVINVDINETGC